VKLVYLYPIYIRSPDPVRTLRGREMYLVLARRLSTNPGLSNDLITTLKHYCSYWHVLMPSIRLVLLDINRCVVLPFRHTEEFGNTASVKVIYTTACVTPTFWHKSYNGHIFLPRIFSNIWINSLFMKMFSKTNGRDIARCLSVKRYDKSVVLCHCLYWLKHR
jgi:hypothetical protein